MAIVPASVLSAFKDMFEGSSCQGRTKSRNTALLGAALLLAVLPFEMEHLLTMFLGALAYFCMYKLSPQVKRSKPSEKVAAESTKFRVAASDAKLRQARPVSRTSGEGVRSEQRDPKVTVMPVLAPTFHGESWEANVNELLVQISPTPECERTVAHLTRLVKRSIWPTFPDAEVVGFASANLNGVKAFGVAVPDLDIVANVSPQVLMQRLQKKGRRGSGATEDFSTKQLQKYAVRICTERLVSSAGLKFRRSAFRGEEPKVTLLVPSTRGFNDKSVPIDFSVNSLAPLHNAALLTECGKIEPRAKALIMLVRRWAKDRGVSHAAKGHLSPYAWTLLVIYFLQVGVEDEGSLLPPLDGFETTSGLRVKRDDSKTEEWVRSSIAPKPVAALFKQFFRFYAHEFDWRNEGVGVESGKRAAPSLSLPLHIMECEDGKGTEVALNIEDPFEAGHNLSSGMTVWSLARLKEEFARAKGICDMDNASLTELLEPWAPATEADAKDELESEALQ